MSAPTDHLQDPDSLSSHAPTGARVVRLGQVSDAATALAGTPVPDQLRDCENHALSAPASESFKARAVPELDSHRLFVPVSAPAGESFEARAVPQLDSRRLFVPDVPAVPPLHLPSRSRLAVVGRLGGVILAIGVIAAIPIGQFPFVDIWHWLAADRTIELASSSARPAPEISAERSVSATPRLFAQASRGMAGEPVPLGLTLRGRADGAVVIITGLVAGMTLSMGGPVGADAWQVPAADLANTWIGPPVDFVGGTELVAELHLADTTIAHRQPIHLEWAAAAKSSCRGATPDCPGTQRQLDRGEVRILLKLGKEFFATGDVAAARLVLQRAAEADDAEAALALAATYDPVVLREVKVYRISPDAAMARAWYEKARELGSAEAPRRLEVLASWAG